MTIVFMFPGQSSRYPAMLARIVAAWPPGKKIVDRASEVVGRNLTVELAPDRRGLFAHNRDVQVGVFLTSYLHQQALASRGVQADLSLGLGLGEYNHLVHSAALEFEAALRLVDARGDAYDRGPGGMMTSVFPLTEDELRPFLLAAGERGTVEIASFNSPSQHVIAGERPAVEAAIRLIEDADPAVQLVTIETRVPMHTSVFHPVAPVFRPALEAAPWKRPVRPYIPNVTAEVIAAPSGPEIVARLARQVWNPVYWRRSIERIVALYPDACFVEVGPGAGLYNLLQKRWWSGRKFRTDHPDDLAGNLARGSLDIANAR